jgi:hypothetical protein
MLVGAEFSLDKRRQLWMEAANTCTDYDNFYLTPGEILGSAQNV